MNDRQTTIRKAAILVASVDGRTAEALLSQMGTEEATAVRRAAAALDDIQDSERDLVLSEFRELTGVAAIAGPVAKRSARPSGRAFLPIQPAGIDLCSPHVGPESGTDWETQATEEPATPTFSRLRQAGSETLAGFLAREQPQTVAVVFMRLAPQQAAEVLRRLPDALQTEVVQRLATTDQADPQVLRDVEQGLETWLSEQVQRSSRPTAGISTATRLLEAATYDVRQTVLANLARRDATLARRLAGNPLRPAASRIVGLTFEDLLQADDATLATVITAADRHVATLALAGASKNVMRRIERRLPGSDWSLLRLSVDRLGPMRLSDVEAAQQQLVALALEMEAETKIDLSAIRPVDVTA